MAKKKVLSEEEKKQYYEIIEFYQNTDRPRLDNTISQFAKKYPDFFNCESKNTVKQRIKRLNKWVKENPQKKVEKKRVQKGYKKTSKGTGKVQNQSSKTSEKPIKQPSSEENQEKRVQKGYKKTSKGTEKGTEKKITDLIPEIVFEGLEFYWRKTVMSAYKSNMKKHPDSSSTRDIKRVWEWIEKTKKEIKNNSS